MKLNIFVAKNLFLGCSGQPKFDDHEPEVFQKSFERHLLTAEPEKVFQFENVNWYHLGSFDDESMKIDLLNEPVLLIRCSDVLNQRKIKEKLLDEAKAREVISHQEVSADVKG